MAVRRGALQLDRVGAKSKCITWRVCVLWRVTFLSLAFLISEMGIMGYLPLKVVEGHVRTAECPAHAEHSINIGFTRSKPKCLEVMKRTSEDKVEARHTSELASGIMGECPADPAIMAQGSLCHSQTLGLREIIVLPGLDFLHLKVRGWPRCYLGTL